MAGLWLLLGSLGVSLSGAILYWKRGSRRMGTPQQRATYQTLHTATLAVSALREGLTSSSSVKAAPALRRLLGTPAIAIADSASLLAYEGPDRHIEALARSLHGVVRSGRSQLLSGSDLHCEHCDDCPVQAGVAVPIAVDGSVVGALAALAPSAEADLLRAAGEVARFVSTQLELAELDASRTRTVQAQLNFLRAQISPHFVYNALTAIESYVRSDPERARDLLVGFAEFIRWSFREHSQYATLAEELRFVDTYLELQRARFGDRLDVSLRVAPEVLPVKVPSLVLQPLVENAIRHGLEQFSGTAQLHITAQDVGHEAIVTVEDAGFGAGHGLTIETEVGAGTKVTMRLPKFSAALSG